MAAAFVTSWLAVIVTASLLTDAQVVTTGLAVNVSTCRCIVMGITSSDCDIQEIRKDHHNFSRSTDFPIRVQNLDMTTIPHMDTKVVDLQMSWQGPDGGALRDTKGFVLQLVLGNMGLQMLHIPVLTTLDRDSNNQVKWTVQCELQDETYGLLLMAKVYPTPLPKNTGEKYVAKSLKIPGSFFEESVLIWAPTLTFSEGEKPDWFYISFIVPVRFEDRLYGFTIDLQPSLGSARDVEIRWTPGGGRFIYRSAQKIKNPATCYTITLAKLFTCNNCDPWACTDGNQGCIGAPLLQASNKLWNGSKCTAQPAGTPVPTPDLMTDSTGSTKDSWIEMYTALPVGPGHADPITVMTEMPGTRTVQMAIFVTIPLTFILVVVVIIVAIKGKCPPRPGRDEDSWNNGRQGMPEPHGSESTGSAAPTTQDISEELGPKCVLMLYSDDHEAHKEVIQQLAAFLQKWCKCTIKLDEWSMGEMSKDIFTWHLRQLETVDKVIFVHSEGAYRKYHAQTMHRQTLTALNPPPKGDPFLNLLPVVLKRIIDKRSSFVMTYFSYTDTEFLISDLCGACTYKLPEHFQEMVLHIHGESKYGCGWKTIIQLVNADDYHSTIEGKNLKHAIENAQKFTKDNPNWFNGRYKYSDCKESVQPDMGHISDGTDSCCNTASFIGEEKVDGLSLIAPNSELNSVVDIPELVGPQELPASDYEADEDLLETSLRLDSGIDTLQGTREEVLGGILPDYSMDGVEVHAGSYENTQGGKGGPPISYAYLHNEYGNPMDDYANSMANYANSTADNGNAAHGYGDSTGDYGYSVDNYGNSTGNYGISTGEYSMGEYNNISQVSKNAPPGGYGNQNGDYENQIEYYGDTPGGYGYSTGDYSSAPGGLRYVPGDYGVTPNDYRNALTDYGSVPHGSQDAQGVQDNLHWEDDGPSENELLPPESISSCTSSMTDLEMQVESQAEQNHPEFHFTNADSIPDTKTDGFVRRSV